MTSRVSLVLSVCCLVVSGCQSVSDVLPWQVAGSQTYTAEELASLNDPTPAAAAVQLDPGFQNGDAGQNIQTVSASAEVPVAAGRIDQLIRNGQAAIRGAGQGNPEKLDQAKQYFEQVLGMDAGHSAAHHGLAIVADLQRDWTSAEGHYKLALQQRPQDPSLLNDLGYSYLLQNRFHEASNYLTQAIQLAPQHERAHINLALLSLKRGDRRGAEARLASIYAPGEISRTIAKMQQDLQQTTGPAAANSTQVVSTAGGPNTGLLQNPAQTPQMYPGPGAPGIQPHQMPPNTGQNGTPGSANPFAGKPIHVYPPGYGDHAQPAPGTTTQPQTIQNTLQPGLQQLPQQGVQIPPGVQQQPANQQQQQGQLSTAVYPGGAQVGTASQSRTLSNTPMLNGAPVGGVLQFPATNQTVPGQNYPSVMNSQAFQPSGNPSPQPSPMSTAPAQGLNVGPGTLFPVAPAAPLNGALQAPLPQQYYPNPPTQNPALQYPPGVMNVPQTQPNRVATVSAQQFTNSYPAEGVAPTAASRMQGYEQQLQQLNGQYQQALQQLNGQGTMMGPAPTLR